MTIIQMLELAGISVGAFAQEHPIWTILGIIATVIGSTVTIKKLELPIYRWARDWINKRLDGLGKRLNASLETKLVEQGKKISSLETTVGQLMTAQANAEAVADRRRADDHRQEILRFNLALVEGSHPDRESYVEILRRIDRYVRYCDEHTDYQNSRADAAIQNIRIHYNHRLKVGFERSTQ